MRWPVGQRLWLLGGEFQTLADRPGGVAAERAQQRVDLIDLSDQLRPTEQRRSARGIWGADRLLASRSSQANSIGQLLGQYGYNGGRFINVPNFRGQSVIQAMD